MLIKNAKLVTPAGVYNPGWLRCKGGVIIALGSGAAPETHEGDIIDAGGDWLLPGFVDIHVHGGMGAEAMDATPEALRAMSRFSAENGVTAFLPTTWTDSAERIQAALANIAACTGPQPDGATIAGAHMEGPYLNPSKCGAQSTLHIRAAARDEVMPWLDMNVIRLISLAPEIPENRWLITECTRRGITVSAAHTAATYDEMLYAASLGVTHATHTYNAMTGLHHREPGTLGAVLTLPQVRCEIIADNIHVHPGAMKLAFAAKGAGGIVLVTDAIRGAGMPDGTYPVDDREITVKDGSARLADGTLAGSILTMNAALRNFMNATGAPLETIWPVTSLNPAQAVGIASRKGSLEIGKDADLVLVDDSISVHLTMVEGRIVYQSTW